MVKLIHASDVHLGITYAGIGKNHREIARELKQAAFDAFETVVNKAIEEVESADIMFIIGTSLQVYPAAGLISYAKENIPNLKYEAVEIFGIVGYNSKDKELVFVRSGLLNTLGEDRRGFNYITLGKFLKARWNIKYI